MTKTDFVADITHHAKMTKEFLTPGVAGGYANEESKSRMVRTAEAHIKAIEALSTAMVVMEQTDAFTKETV